MVSLVSLQAAARADARAFLAAALGKSTEELAEAVRAAHERLVEHGVIGRARTALEWARMSPEARAQDTVMWDVAARFAIAMLESPDELVVVVPAPSRIWEEKLVELLVAIRAGHGIEMEVEVVHPEAAAAAEEAR